MVYADTGSTSYFEGVFLQKRARVTMDPKWNLRHLLLYAHPLENCQLVGIDQGACVMFSWEFVPENPVGNLCL